MYCNILVTKPFDQVFTYKLSSNQECRVGNIVSVPFGKKEDQIGMITEIFEDLPVKDNTYSIKTVGFVFDNIILSKNIIKFITWISDYTLAPLGLVLKLFLINFKIVSHDYLKEKDDLLLANPVQLNNEQQKAFEIIDNSLFKKSLPIVLEGVTGSGKTEVYFEAIEKVLMQSKQVLIMLPEISLTPQFEKRFNSRFGFPPLVWHSKISDKKRKNIWHRCYEGDTTIVVGARSSLFLPFNNLGLIVVDEEHDSSYKQEDNIRYQARDLAIVRSQIEKFTIICHQQPLLLKHKTT